MNATANSLGMTHTTYTDPSGFNFGGIGDKEALRTLELFASRVMPTFRPR